MRREVILAIAIGFSIGLLIAAGVLLGRKNIRQGIKLFPRKEEVTVSPTPAEITNLSPSPISSISPIPLTITFPEDESIVDKDKINLEGKTEPEAIISVIYEEGEALGEADENGEFSFEISLISGANEITVTAYSLEGQEASKTITVVYTTAEI